MKRIKIYVFAIVAMLCASCDKQPCNGKLDGMWHLISVCYRNTSVGDSTVNIKTKHIYLSFQLQLAQFTMGNLSSEIAPIVYARFDKSSNTLSLYDFYYHNSSTNIIESNDATDILQTDSLSTTMRPIGIDGISAEFHIDKLTNSVMQLTSDFAKISLKKL